MKKTIPALVAAFLITAFLAAIMILIGQDAISTSSAAAAPAINASAASEIKQLLVGYQTREIQYQAQIKSATDQIAAANVQIDQAKRQIDQANQQVQQYQAILAELQSRGLITIAPDGAITIH